jgi:hypothetical protein
MMRRIALFLLFFCPFFALAAETVNSSVGQVGDHVVTAREVWISNYLERWNLARKSSEGAMKAPTADWKPALKSEAFNQAASSFMLEYMVAQEAENFSIAQVDPAEAKKEAQEFLKAVAGSSEWSKFEASSSEIEKFIERKHRTQNFLKFKTDSAGVTVTDEEAKAYYEKNRMKFGNLPFAQFKDSIKEVLSRQMLEDRLKDWFEVLRRKYRVRFLGSSS